MNNEYQDAVEVRVYAIFDNKINKFQKPFFVEYDVQAERMFIKLLRDEGTIMHEFPEDFDLYFVGRFHLDSGGFTQGGQEKLVQGKNIIKKEV